MNMKNLNVAFVGLLACSLLFSVVFNSCNNEKKETSTVTESMAIDTPMTAKPDSGRMDTAVSMPVKTTN